MSRVKILAPAKINLALDVLKKTASGFHKIQTILHEIPELSDEITIISTKDQDKLSILHCPKLKSQKRLSKMPKTKISTATNLALHALLLLKKTYKIKKFAHITIKKNIPLSSGLGGASSDAAATLKGLNELWSLKLSTKTLLKLAAKLGSDVPFFIIGGTALGTNYGEKITELPPIKNLKFKIHFNNKLPESIRHSHSKTHSAYRSLNLSLCGKNLQKTKALISAIKTGDTKAILENFHNDFEQLYHIGKNHHLSGSGPSTFTVFRAVN